MNGLAGFVAAAIGAGWLEVRPRLSGRRRWLVKKHPALSRRVKHALFLKMKGGPIYPKS